ncbi:MAG: PadR family transcriptional regulator, partial [Bacilli bacterium]|nr:PadR family transcriptional regulator [Bacilli bacterium]
MEYIILSMLLCKSMTVYEIRSYVVKNLSTVCSNSLGSIQVAIKKLLGKGYIEVKAFTENGLNKKEYRITDKGVAEYKDWV